MVAVAAPAEDVFDAFGHLSTKAPALPATQAAARSQPTPSGLAAAPNVGDRVIVRAPLGSSCKYEGREAFVFSLHETKCRLLLDDHPPRPDAPIRGVITGMVSQTVCVTNKKAVPQPEPGSWRLENFHLVARLSPVSSEWQIGMRVLVSTGKYAGKTGSIISVHPESVTLMMDATGDVTGYLRQRKLALPQIVDGAANTAQQVINAFDEGHGRRPKWQPFGALCKDGTLNMTFRQNKLHEKFLCKDGYCRCGRITEDEQVGAGWPKPVVTQPSPTSRSLPEQRESAVGHESRWQPAGLCKDGSLNMNFAANKPHKKYNCADGVCRCDPFIR